MPDHDLLEPARDEVEPGRRVAAARQRQPQVQRAHVAHERAVLVPGAGDLRLRLAQRRLVRGQQRLLAEVARHEAREPCAPEQLEHVEHQPRRVDGEHAAALLDPRPHVLHVVTGLRLELVVEAVARAAPGARGERRVDPRGERQRIVAADEAAHEQAAVAQDPRAQQLRRDLGGGDRGQCARRSERGRVGRGVGRRARSEHPDAGRVAQADEPALALAVALSRLAVVRRSISASSSARVSGSSTAVRWPVLLAAEGEE